MNIVDVLIFLYPGINFVRGDVVVMDNGAGSFIAEWNITAKCPTLEEMQAIADSTGYKAWIKAKQEANIDSSTGKAINTAVHSLAGAEESMGIVRDQLAHILNGDIAATEDFTRLNKIAITEIEKAHIAKEAL